jgi:energy-converting hydrogenase Eha subunit F
MSKNQPFIEPEKVYPQEQAKRIEIEVYAGFYRAGGGPFISAGVVGAQYPAHRPPAEITKRYVFSIEEPIFPSDKGDSQ